MSEPRFVERPRPWRGTELFSLPGWEQSLAPEELGALRAGDRGDTGALGALRARAEDLREHLETGSGACLVRGLGALLDEGLDPVRLFTGFVQAVGTAVPQDPQGRRLLHVRDEGFGPDDPRFRGPHSNQKLAFHSDRCDVIAFLCLQPASSGGANELVSAVGLHNDLLAEARELCAALYEPLAYLRHTVDGGNPRPYTRVPLFSSCRGHFAASYLRVLIDRADRSPDAPDLTDLQRRALDRLDELASEPGRSARFRLERGDVLLINNWVNLHRRQAFVDDPGAPRHLLRAWLSVPGSRPLAPELQDHFGDCAPGAVRGGFRVT